jgi:phosphoribosylanthranilate isomerase
VAPEMVDVSGGVESAPGIKDPVKVAEFINQAKRAAVGL